MTAWRALLEVNNALVATRHLPQLIQRIMATLGNLVRYDHVVLTLYDEVSNELRIAALIPDVPPEDKAALDRAARIPLEGSAPGLAFTSKRPLLLTAFEPAQFPSQFSRRPRVRRQVGLLRPAADRGSHARGVDCVRAGGGAVRSARPRPPRADRWSGGDRHRERTGVPGDLRAQGSDCEREDLPGRGNCGEPNFDEIIGERAALSRVLGQVETVAPTESTVLLLGETGTGKELVARAVHDRSGRRGRALVKVNCAAIPSGLLESELFGHEKGAFTGAIERKIGRFELAHQGTLFLDEVGDIPLELQDLARKERHLDQARRLQAVGVATDYDVLAAAVTVENARPAVIRGQNAVRLAPEQLRFLLAEGTKDIDATGTLATPIEAAPSYATVLTQALANRPELAELADQRGILRELVTIAAAGNRPRVDLAVSLGTRNLGVSNCRRAARRGTPRCSPRCRCSTDSLRADASGRPRAKWRGFRSTSSSCVTPSPSKRGPQ